MHSSPLPEQTNVKGDYDDDVDVGDGGVDCVARGLLGRGVVLSGLRVVNRLAK